MQKDSRMKKIQKEASCKSILLLEEAEKRGISPSKSSRSVRSISKGVSPVKQYFSKDN